MTRRTWWCIGLSLAGAVAVALLLGLLLGLPVQQRAAANAAAERGASMSSSGGFADALAAVGASAAAVARQAPPAAATTAAPDVLVIGAGVAGLKAAADLLAAGAVGAVSKLPLSVTVLEASSRPLGRVATLPKGIDGWPIPVELGGQWLHGVKTNPLVRVANAARLPLVSTGTGDDEVVYNGSQRVPESQSDSWWELHDAFDPAFLDAYRDGLGSSASKTGLDAAVQAYMEDRGMDADTRRGFSATVESAYVQEYAASTDRLSLAYFDAGRDEAGPDAVIVGERGMSSLFGPTLGAVNDLRLGHTVTSITWTGSNGEPLQVNATTASGAAVSFAPRFVICTLPLGVLQANLATLFPGPVGTPAGLSANKVRAINSLGMGHYNKVILHFSTPFWTKPAHAGSNQWVARLAGTDTSQPIEFFSLHRATGAPVLVAFFAGTPAAVNEAADDAMTLANVMAAVRQMFGPGTPDPLRHIITKWGSHPLFRGSYSFVPVGAAGNARAVLAQPEANNALHFAGEATRTDFPSTIHGAWLSGAAAAKAVLTRA